MGFNSAFKGLMYGLFCVVLCIVCVYICTELLPPGGYPIAVKYIILYYIILYYIILYYIILYYIISSSVLVVFVFSQGNSQVASAVQAAARSNVHGTATAQQCTMQTTHRLILQPITFGIVVYQVCWHQSRAVHSHSL